MIALPNFLLDTCIILFKKIFGAIGKTDSLVLENNLRLCSTSVKLQSFIIQQRDDGQTILMNTDKLE